MGLNVDGAGWAAEGHAPAIRAVDGLALAGVATRSVESARRAAERFDIPQVYGSAADLIADPAIDIVAVISPVPTHREYILEAGRAGKHVITEWPVAPGADVMQQIAADAERFPVHYAVNLQARQSPAVTRAATLLAAGELGRIRSVNVLSATAGFGPRIPAAYLPLEEPATWTSLGTIQTAHTLDTVIALAGQVQELHPLLDIQYSDVAADDGRTAVRTLPDHVLLHGRFASGATLSMEVIGGRPAENSPFRLEVFGDRGELVITGGGPRGFQAGPLTLHVDGRLHADNESGFAELTSSAVNVAHTYQALRDDIANGTTTTPTLRQAADLASLLRGLGIGAPQAHGSGPDITPVP